MVLVLACIAAAGSFNLARTKAEQIPVYNIESAARPQLDDLSVRNILLVGTDNSDGVDPDNPILKGRGGEHLADTIMILRVDPVAKEAAILSIPRDTWVPVAPNWGTTKINGALSRTDGQSQLISTIRHNFGISIDNYIEVNLQGFMSVFDVLGGITVYNTMPIKDGKTGLDISTVGCYHLSPTMALAYARTRELHYQDDKGKWRTDSSSDYGRIARQQDLLKQAANAAINKGVHNPVTAYKLVDSTLGSFATDATINADFILQLISTFREFPIDQLKTHRLPTVSVNRSYENVLWDEALPLLTWFQGLKAPGAVEPNDVVVTMPESNAQAEEFAGALDAAGFDAALVSDKGLSGPTRVKQTTIRYGDGGAEAAQLLAAHLDIEADDIDFVHDDELPGRRVELLPSSAELRLREQPVSIESIASSAKFVAPSTTTPDLNDLATTTTSPNETDSASETTDTTGRGGTVDGAERTTTTTPTNSPDASGRSPSSLTEEPPLTESVGIIPFDAAAAAMCAG